MNRPLLPGKWILKMAHQLAAEELVRQEATINSETVGQEVANNIRWLCLGLIQYLNAHYSFTCPHCHIQYRGTDVCPTCQVCQCGALMVNGECSSWHGVTKQ